MRWNNVSFIISIILLIVSLLIINYKNFNWSIDFTGGTLIEINLDKSTHLDQIRTILQKSNFKKLTLQHYDNNRNIIVRLPISDNINNIQKVSNDIISIINTNNNIHAVLSRAEYIGPSISIDLIQTGFVALIVALISMLVYIWLRFEWRLAVGVIIALIHDIIITVGILSLLYVEINLTTLASLIAVISYSLNDSIIIFDRIRENFRTINSGTAYEIFNLSLTQTLHRTMITAGITITVIMTLYLFGGSIMQGFSITMLVGVIIGTISSIYVASALALKLGTKREYLLLNIANKRKLY